MRFRHLCMMGALCVLPVAGFAIPTGLNAMPTAEALDLGSMRTEYEYGDSRKLYVPDGGNLYGWQVGLPLGLEAGVDHVSDLGTVYNAKWQLKGDGLMFPALAVGVQGVTSGEKPQYYAVATKGLTLVKVSAGVLRDANSDDTLTMFGASGELGPVEVQVDHINGGGNDRTSAGLGIRLGSVRLSGIVYDVENAEDEITVMASYRYVAF